MSKKSRQHVIPQVYLRAFCDARPPVGHPAGKPFTPALWAHDSSLCSAPTRVAPHNVAWTRDAYSLVVDDADRPWLEEGLSRLESLYAAAMRRVNSGSHLTTEDSALISLFVGALHARTLPTMADRQTFFDQITGFARAYMGDAADKSIEPWGELADAGKRQIVPAAEAFARVAGPHMLLVENRTPMPFITSSGPVTVQHLHVDEVLGLGVPPEWLYRDIPESARELSATCALTPSLAYVASRFFPPKPEAVRVATTELQLVFGLNEVTRTHARETVFAPSATPYGRLLPAAEEHDRRRVAAAAMPQTGLRIYTDTKRYWLPTVKLIHGCGEHALTGRLTFSTTDLQSLQLVAAESRLVNVEVYDDGQLVGGMRDAWFVLVGVTPNAESVIENGPLGPTPWRPAP